MHLGVFMKFQYFHKKLPNTSEYQEIVISHALQVWQNDVFLMHVHEILIFHILYKMKLFT